MGFLLNKDEKIDVQLQIADVLTAPVSAGSQVGSIKYLVDGQVYKVEYIVATDDIPAIDFFWCLEQILLRFSL